MMLRSSPYSDVTRPGFLLVCLGQKYGVLFCLFIDATYVLSHSIDETATGITIGKFNDPNYLLERMFGYFHPQK